YNWNSELTLSAARSRLNGAAADWWLLKQDDIRTWDEFKESFSKAFIGVESKSELYDKCKDRRQMPSEDTVTYFFAKTKLCKKIGFDFSDTKEQVLRGIRSELLYTALVSKQHSSEEELLADIRQFERIEAERKSMKRSKETVPEDHSLHKNIRCFKCNNRGHIAKNCTSEPASRNEPKSFSSKRNDAVVKKEFVKKDIRVAVSNESCNNGSFIAVEIDNNVLSAQVDTGAQVSLVKFSLVSQLKKSIVTKHGTITITG